MRNITLSRVEQRAREANLTTINLEFAARVIEEGRSLDNEVLGTYYQQEQSPKVYQGGHLEISPFSNHCQGQINGYNESRKWTI